MDNDHINLCSEETNAENNAGLVVHLCRIVPHIHSAVFSALYMCKKSAIEIIVESDKISVFHIAENRCKSLFNNAI